MHNIENPGIEDLCLLTPMQQGILLDSLRAAEADRYLCQSVYRLEGRLDLYAFEQAWREVIRRHSILRTTFLWDELDFPVQVVHESAALNIRTYDWRDVPAAELQARTEEYLEQDRIRRIDFSTAPLMRVALLQTSDDAYRLVWSVHHSILDGWSSALVLKEVTAYYGAYSRRGELGLPCPPPYSVYIAWLQQQDRAKTEAFWRRALRGVSTPTPLPGTSRTGCSGVAQGVVHMSAAATQSVRTFALQNQLTLNTIVQGAWALLLSRYSGENEVVFGATVSGRPYSLPGVEGIVGLFINTLPVRVRLSPEETVVAWLKRLQEQQAETRQYEHAALTDLRSWSDVPHGTPLFQSIVVFENFSSDAFEQRYGEDLLSGAASNGDLRVTYLHDSPVVSYPLSLAVGPAQGLLLRLNYDRSYFSQPDAERLLTHFQTALKNMVAAFEQPLQKLNLLTERDRKIVLSVWNRAEHDYGRPSTLNELIELQSAERPDRVALIAESGQLSYAELNRRANQLAHHLRRLGVGPEECVALCVERGLEMVIGLLGVLKAGGTYLPLDPDYPTKRLAYLLEDTGARVLLTQQAVIPRLPKHDAATICLDSDWKRMEGESCVNAVPLARPGNLAYLIYTSGSTGRPKGVGIAHQSLFHYVSSITRRISFTADNSYLMPSTFAADLGNTILFPALCAGGSLHLVSQETSADPEMLQRYFWHHRPGCLKITPSHLRAVALGETAAVIPERDLILGGEASSWEWVQHLRKLKPGCRFWNHYGPTETTVGVLTYEVSGEAEAGNVPLGRPLDNVVVYVLDEFGEPVPIGLPGELYIGGGGVARGYLKQPALTAARFLPDPFSNIGGARLYRSGDQVKWLEDGNLEFLGRSDNQIKIRGYRVESGEIEQVLAEFEGVKQAVAIAREDEPGDQRLAAYVVGRIEIPQLRAYLQARLPDYMVPGAIVLLERLPLMLNGKVDRKRLPRPEVQATLGTHCAPRTPVDEILTGIWSQILQIPKIGIHDNFFELGGHSLLATQVISRIREAFGIELPFRLLFENPTVAGMAMQIDESQSKCLPPPVAPVTRSEPLPLSFAQQRLWFIDQLEPGSPLYNLSATVQLQGELDVGALQRSLSELVRRHEVLRTSFPNCNGEAVQQIAPPSSMALPIVNLEALGESHLPVALSLAQIEAVRPFDLARGPLLRGMLLRLGIDRHVALITMHHIVSDRWSKGLFIGELSTLYEAYRCGQESPLAELPVQYADYAVWQRQWLQGEVLEEQLCYWRRQLAGVPALDLPTDFPRPSVSTYRGAMASFILSRDVMGRLRELSRSESVTLFMTLLAGFQLLLGRWSGQKDFAIGIDIANRNRKETERLIGFFVNQLVLRTNLKGSPSFRELLARVRETALEAYAHQDLPFERLVDELQPERALNRSPLFQAKLVWQNVPEEELRLSGVQVSDSLRTELRVSRFDLSLILNEQAEAGIPGMVEYATDLFEPETVQRMIDSYRLLLESASADPEQQVDQIDLLGETERHQILVEWNRTEHDCDRLPTLNELIELQSAERPDRVALVAESGQLSYAELNRRANQLAHHLRRLGVGPEECVALCVERGLEMVIGLLGVLKAGGAYIPLDPAYPHERLSFMLEDSRPLVVLTQERLTERLSSHSANLFCLDRDFMAITAGEEVQALRQAMPEELAYIIYTSGSTGRPKGVQISHGSMMNLLLSMKRCPGLTADDVLCAVTSISFDIAALEILLPLIIGGRVIVVRADAVRDGGKLMEELEINEATAMQATPATWRMLLESKGGRERAVKKLCGGEALGQELSERLVNWPGEVWNLYGPTETTIWSAIEQVRGGRKRVTIGRGIADTQLYVLGEGNELMLVGVPGELYIGGGGVGRGYLRRAGLTAEKFVPDEFRSGGGARLYRTGDRVRWLANGTLEFLGRIDFQVKLRGNRIEVGEIESVLGEQEGVQQAVVVMREERLIAYVVGQAEAEQLRAKLQSRLPNYMVPGVITMVEELPLTPNGKVDRKALPEPEMEEMRGETGPRTPIEEILTGIWTQMLRRQVGLHDNFFELGGHSLLATQLVSRLREAFAIELSVRSIFETPTVSGLAARIERARMESLNSVLPPIVRAERTGHSGGLPLSFAQQRLWFIDQSNPGSAAYSIQFLTRITEAVSIFAMERGLSEIVRRHEILRTSFAVHNGVPSQFIAPPHPVQLPLVDVSALGQEQSFKLAHALVIRRAEEFFDLSRGPLWRTLLVRLNEADYLLLVNMHHIVSDGWSMDIMANEFTVFYEAYRRGEEASLAELPIQYADYAIWQRQWLQPAALDRYLAYWRDQLRGAPLLQLPADFSRHSGTHRRGGRVQIVISRNISDELRAISRREGATTFMVLLTAFKLLLARWTGQEDVVVGTDVQNRSSKELEALIGFFVNQLVLRTDLSGSPTFLEALARVRRTALDAYSNSEVPFERLVQELKPERNLDWSPFFPVSITWQNGTEVAATSGTALEMARPTTPKLDLSLFLQDTPEISGAICYDAELFEQETIERLVRRFQHLLDRITTDPTQTLVELDNDFAEVEAVFTFCNALDELENAQVLK
jgi:amino acid adenylation domain-containing protein